MHVLIWVMAAILISNEYERRGHAIAREDRSVVSAAAGHEAAGNSGGAGQVVQAVPQHGIQGIGIARRPLAEIEGDAAFLPDPVAERLQLGFESIEGILRERAGVDAK